MNHTLTMKISLNQESRAKILKHSVYILILITIASFMTLITDHERLFNENHINRNSSNGFWNYKSFMGTPELVSVNTGVISLNSLAGRIISSLNADWLYPLLAVIGIYLIVVLRSKDKLIAVIFGIFYLFLFYLPSLKQEDKLFIESLAYLPWFLLSLHLYIQKFSLTRMGFFLFNYILTAYSDNIKLSVYVFSVSLLTIGLDSVKLLKNRKFKTFIGKTGFFIISSFVIMPNLIITWIKNISLSEQLELINNTFTEVNKVNSLSEQVYSFLNLPYSLKNIFDYSNSIGISSILFVFLVISILLTYKKSVKIFIYLTLLISVHFVINTKTEFRNSTTIELSAFCGLLIMYYLSEWFSDIRNNYIIIDKPIKILISAAVFLILIIISSISFLFVESTPVNLSIFRQSIFFYSTAIILLLGFYTFAIRKISGYLLLVLCLAIMFSDFLFMQFNSNTTTIDTTENNSWDFKRSSLKDLRLEDGNFFYPDRHFYNDPWAEYLPMLNGNTKMISSRYRDVTAKLIDSKKISGDPMNWNVINMLNTRYILFNMKLELPYLKYIHYDRSNNLILYENSGNLPPVRTIHKIINCSSEEALLDSLVNTNNIKELAFTFSDSVQTCIYPEKSDIKDVKQTESSVSFNINVKDSAFVVIAKSYFKDLYSLQIDGKEHEYVPVNQCLIGFPVYSGTHKISFSIIQHDNKVWTFLQSILILLSILFIIFSKIKYLCYCFPERTEKIKAKAVNLINKWRSNGKT